MKITRIANGPRLTLTVSDAELETLRWALGEAIDGNMEADRDAVPAAQALLDAMDEGEQGEGFGGVDG